MSQCHQYQLHHKNWNKSVKLKLKMWNAHKQENSAGLSGLSEILSLCGDLLMYNHRIVIPAALRKDILNKIHEGHQGVERCRMRARQSVWWPGVSSQIQQLVENCSECAKHVKPQREPLLPTPLPDYPWQMVGTDLCEHKGIQYLITVDYYSRYPEIHQLKSTTSTAIISILKAIFARHGIPEILRSDNGPQFVSYEFIEFARKYGFRHITSSPKYPQSNGEVECMVKTVKGLLESSEDPHLAVLSYRATPMPWCKLSPSELLMGRKLRTTIPQTTKMLTPEWSYLPQFRRDNVQFKSKQKENYDQRHRVQVQAEIPNGSEVVITSENQLVDGRVCFFGVHFECCDSFHLLLSSYFRIWTVKEQRIEV